MKANLMKRPPTTDGMMNLRSLVEKSADADLLREMIGLLPRRSGLALTTSWKPAYGSAHPAVSPPIAAGILGQPAKAILEFA
ncbi:MAG TPA: hypothetical protein VK181_11085 [Rhizobium sp.]|nr:hypothetical protein [Rhizobium sp.]